MLQCVLVLSVLTRGVVKPSSLCVMQRVAVLIGKRWVWKGGFPHLVFEGRHDGVGIVKFLGMLLSK